MTNQIDYIECKTAYRLLCQGWLELFLCAAGCVKCDLVGIRTHRMLVQVTWEKLGHLARRL